MHIRLSYANTYRGEFFHRILSHPELRGRLEDYVDLEEWGRSLQALKNSYKSIIPTYEAGKMSK